MRSWQPADMVRVRVWQQRLGTVTISQYPGRCGNHGLYLWHTKGKFQVDEVINTAVDIVVPENQQTSGQ